LSTRYVPGKQTRQDFRPRPLVYLFVVFGFLFMPHNTTLACTHCVYIYILYTGVRKVLTNLIGYLSTPVYLMNISRDSCVAFLRYRARDGGRTGGKPNMRYKNFLKFNSRDRVNTDKRLNRFCKRKIFVTFFVLLVYNVGI